MTDTPCTAWANTVVRVEPFPRNPYTDEQFDRISDVVMDKNWDTNDVSPSSSNGVLEISWPTQDVPPELRAGQVARLLADLDIEAASIVGYVEWTVMKEAS